MYMASHANKDYFAELAKNGITGELEKYAIPPHLGWYNQIVWYGNYYCDNAKDAEKALQIFTDCGFNCCRIEKTRTIAIMHDTKKA